MQVLCGETGSGPSDIIILKDISGTPTAINTALLEIGGQWYKEKLDRDSINIIPKRQQGGSSEIGEYIYYFKNWMPYRSGDDWTIYEQFLTKNN